MQYLRQPSSAIQTKPRTLNSLLLHITASGHQFILTVPYTLHLPPYFTQEVESPAELSHSSPKGLQMPNPTEPWLAVPQHCFASLATRDPCTRPPRKTTFPMLTDSLQESLSHIETPWSYSNSQTCCHPAFPAAAWAATVAIILRKILQEKPNYRCTRKHAIHATQWMPGLWNSQ